MARPGKAYESERPSTRLHIAELSITFFIMPVSLYILILAMLAVVMYRLRNVGRRPPSYPPGPPTLPLIGNLHLMPRQKGHLQFHKWAEEYGPVYSLILGTSVMIVLSSDQAIKDLLDKRSNIYSSRPDMYMARIVSGGNRMLLMVSLGRADLERLALIMLRSMAIPGGCCARSFTTV